MADHLLAQIIAGVFALLAALGGGIAISRRSSDAKRSKAQDHAESSVFENALGEMMQDRNRWRTTTEECWVRIRKLERQNALYGAQLRSQGAQISIMRKLARRIPEIETFLPTDMGRLDPADGDTDPKTGHAPLGTDKQPPRGRS